MRTIQVKQISGTCGYVGYVEDDSGGVVGHIFHDGGVGVLISEPDLHKATAKAMYMAAVNHKSASVLEGFEVQDAEKTSLHMGDIMEKDAQNTPDKEIFGVARSPDFNPETRLGKVFASILVASGALTEKVHEMLGSGAFSRAAFGLVLAAALTGMASPALAKNGHVVKSDFGTSITETSLVSRDLNLGEEDRDEEKAIHSSNPKELRYLYRKYNQSYSQVVYEIAKNPHLSQDVIQKMLHKLDTIVDQKDNGDGWLILQAAYLVGNKALSAHDRHHLHEKLAYFAVNVGPGKEEGVLKALKNVPGEIPAQLRQQLTNKYGPSPKW